MPSPPKTQPEMWVPAGAERREEGRNSVAEPRAGRRKPNVPPHPPQRQARAFHLQRARATNLLWASLAATIPWLWFLVRDLGPVAQLVALAMPALVVASLLGLIISVFDERKLSSVLVAVSVLTFGWVTIFGPRSAMPASPPVDPIRIASMTLDGSTLNASAIMGSLARQRADIAIIVEPSKKTRTVLLRTDRSPYALTSGRFVVLSSIQVSELPPPKGLPGDLILRLEVDRLDGSFIVYAVRAGTSPLDAAQNDPIGADRLLEAARNERLPVVIAGDLGISDRSTEYRTLTATFRDAMRSGARAASTASTSPWTFLYLRSEFVLISPQMCAAAGSTFDVQGAQTAGLVTGVGSCSR